MSEHGFKRDPDDSSIDLRKHQREFYEEYFRKGVELTQALLTENEELRTRLAELEERSRREGSATDNYERIERDHHDLACLFVTQSQLGRATDVREATTVITEVLLNFVGADRFAIYITNGEAHPRPLYVYNVDRRALGEPSSRVIDAASTGDTHLGGVDRREVSEEPVIAFPLRSNIGPYGAIAIWSFLRQKTALAPIDRRLFEVVSWAGGAALEIARLRGKPQSTDLPDRYSVLSLLLGLS